MLLTVSACIANGALTMVLGQWHVIPCVTYLLEAY